MNRRLGRRQCSALDGTVIVSVVNSLTKEKVEIAFMDEESVLNGELDLAGKNSTDIRGSR